MTTAHNERVTVIATSASGKYLTVFMICSKHEMIARLTNQGGEPELSFEMNKMRAFETEPLGAAKAN